MPQRFLIRKQSTWQLQQQTRRKSRDPRVYGHFLYGRRFWNSVKGIIPHASLWLRDNPDTIGSVVFTLTCNNLFLWCFFVIFLEYKISQRSWQGQISWNIGNNCQKMSAMKRKHSCTLIHTQWPSPYSVRQAGLSTIIYTCMVAVEWYIPWP